MSEARPADLVQAMFDAALAVRRNAYVPGCRFPVGACLRAESGELFVGVNVENPVSSMSICAETSALGAAVSAGARLLTDIVVVGGSPEICPPCGGCRQRLMPFADARTMVHLCTPVHGVAVSVALTALVPRFCTRAHGRPG